MSWCKFAVCELKTLYLDRLPEFHSTNFILLSLLIIARSNQYQYQWKLNHHFLLLVHTTLLWAWTTEPGFTHSARMVNTLHDFSMFFIFLLFLRIVVHFFCNINNGFTSFGLVHVCKQMCYFMFIFVELKYNHSQSCSVLWYANNYYNHFYAPPGLCPGLPGWAGTRKVTSGISWARCNFAPRPRQIATLLSTSAPHHSVFYRPYALPAAQPTVSKHWGHK